MNAGSCDFISKMICNYWEKSLWIMMDRMRSVFSANCKVLYIPHSPHCIANFLNTLQMCIRRARCNKRFCCRIDIFMHYLSCERFADQKSSQIKNGGARIQFRENTEGDSRPEDLGDSWMFIVLGVQEFESSNENDGKKFRDKLLLYVNRNCTYSASSKHLLRIYVSQCFMTDLAKK